MYREKGGTLKGTYMVCERENLGESAVRGKWDCKEVQR